MTPLLLGLVLLVLSAGTVCLVRIARDIRADVRKVHLQQANIIGMLLRAGFRPANASRDWLEDADKTQLPIDPQFTRFDWRTPEERHRR